MKINQLTIENFRGIKRLDWKPPLNQRLIVLIGPGDSGKSTILEALHYLLGDRWNIPFSDTDFFGVDHSEEISIKAVITELPDTLLKDSAFGLWLSGLSADGELHQDPEDGCQPALIIRLSVDAGLEPKWMVERADGQFTIITASQRNAFSTFKVDERNDSQLRWTRTSGLGRLSAKNGGDREALSAASRAARDALSEHENSSLAELAQQVQEQANRIGGGRFVDIKPGLDTSRSSMGAGLALYENVIPLTSFGLGSRRLASFAVQQLAAGSRSVAVVDEIECGLEPHRAVRLLDYLRTSQEYSQVFVSTHSPVIVEQAQLENIAIVRSDEGVVTVSHLAGTDERMRKMRRGRPSSFLARKVIIVEGATEFGLLSEFLKHCDEERFEQGLSTVAGEGVVIQDGGGGAEVPLRAIGMTELGYEVIGFMDNDVRSADKQVKQAQQKGIAIVQWDKGHNTESQICAGLEADALTSFISLAIERRNSEATVLQDLNDVDTTSRVTSLSVHDWLQGGLSIEDAQQRVIKAATERKWFKEIEGGKVLGRWLVDKIDEPFLVAVVLRLTAIKSFIFANDPTGDSSEAEMGGEQNDG